MISSQLDYRVSYRFVRDGEVFSVEVADDVNGYDRPNTYRARIHRHVRVASDEVEPTMWEVYGDTADEVYQKAYTFLDEGHANAGNEV